MIKQDKLIFIKNIYPVTEIPASVLQKNLSERKILTIIEKGFTMGEDENPVRKRSWILVDEYYMRLALEEAQKAKVLGEAPIGAVLVKNGEILAKGYNLREKDQQVTSHAEIIAMQQANLRLHSWRLTDTVLYVTMEPCAMCGGAMIQSRISRVVFGAYDPKGGVCGSLFNLFEQEGLNHKVEVTGGVLEESCSNILTEFFQEIRRAKKKEKAQKKMPENHQ